MKSSSADLLYHDLPAVFDGDAYIIFSPAVRKAARIDKSKIHNQAIFQRLTEQGFFKKAPQRAYGTIANLGLILTTACNLCCEYCYVIHDNKPLFMTKEYAIRILEEYSKKDRGSIRVSFFGGEPTLNSETLKAAVSYVKDTWEKYQFHITTNGTADDALYDYLISENFYFTVSLDAAHGTTDKQRPVIQGAQPANTADNTIRRLIKNGSLLQVRITLTANNIRSFPDFIRYCSELGVRFVHFEAVSPTPNSTFLQPNKEIYVDQVRQALSVAQECKVYLINSSYMNLLTPSDRFCSSVAGSKKLYSPDGTVSACYKIQSYETATKEFVIGRYNDYTLEENPDNQEYMHRLSVNAYPECANCFAKYICAGGCPHRNLLSTGDMCRPDPFMCDVKKGLISDAIIRIYNGSSNNQESVVLGSTLFEKAVHNHNMRSIR